MNQIVLRQEQKQIVLRQEIKQYNLQGGPIVANILAFSFIATSNGQTVFTMLNAQGQPITFTTIICFFIMGTGQNPLNIPADYTVNGNQITLGASASYMEIGDVGFGSGQI